MPTRADEVNLLPDVEDAVQGYYEMLITRGSIRSVSQERGRLRSFLLSTFERYLIDQWEKRSAAKRGGGKHHLSLDQEKAGLHYFEGDEPQPDAGARVRAALGAHLARTRDGGPSHSDYKRTRQGGRFSLSPASGPLRMEQRQTSPTRRPMPRINMNENAVKQAVFRIEEKVSRATALGSRGDARQPGGR